MYSAINLYYNLFRGALNFNAFCHSKVPAFLNVVDMCAGFEFQQFSFAFCHSKVPAFLNVVDMCAGFEFQQFSFAFCHSKVPAFLNVVDTCAGFEFQQFSFAFCHSKVPAFLNVVDMCAGFEFQQFSFAFCHSKVPAFLNVVDIAGLVKGAHEGQGLGNAFLSNISACDAIFHMSREYLCGRSVVQSNYGAKPRCSQSSTVILWPACSLPTLRSMCLVRLSQKPVDFIT